MTTARGPGSGLRRAGGCRSVAGDHDLCRILTVSLEWGPGRVGGNEPVTPSIAISTSNAATPSSESAFPAVSREDMDAEEMYSSCGES